MHYGQSRPKDAKFLAQYDVVLTTYGVLSSEFLAEVAQRSSFYLYLFLFCFSMGPIFHYAVFLIMTER